jgi:hypothetical protein
MEPKKTAMLSSEPQNDCVIKDVHNLYDKWVLWAHLPHDTDWSLGSYKKIMTIETVEDMIAVCKGIPEKMVKNCMLFIMRSGITPTWEDKRNRNGGCFSFKTTNKSVHSVWKNMGCMLVGETLSNNNKLLQNINGITISPKRSFCIIKVWIGSCTHQDPELLGDIPDLSKHGCLFKRHIPEY